MTCRSKSAGRITAFATDKGGFDAQEQSRRGEEIFLCGFAPVASDNMVQCLFIDAIFSNVLVRHSLQA